MHKPKIKKRSFRNFLKSDSGNIAITSAIALPVTLSIGFMAMDYGILLNSDQRLKSAAEAAALAAVNEAETVSEENPLIDVEAITKDRAEKVFRSRVSEMKYVELDTVTVTPTQVGNRISTTIEYDASYNTLAMGLVGKQKFDISNRRRATVSTLRYININLLVDGSGSMGIGATTSDQQLMQNQTNCTFACHGDTYDTARDIGATMRIDVAREAAMDAVDVVKANSQVDDHVTMGVYRYGQRLETISAFDDSASGNLDTVKSRIQNGVFMLPKADAGTATEEAMKALAAQMPAGGYGRRPDDRLQYMVVVTDAVEDTRFNGNTKSGNFIQPTNNPKINNNRIHVMNPAICEAIRDKNIEIYFIETEYLTPTFGSFQYIYNGIKDQLKPIIPERLAECTGNSEQVIKTVDPDDIKFALEEILGDLSSPLRLY